MSSRTLLISLLALLVATPAAAPAGLGVGAVARPGFTLPVPPPAVVLTPFDPPDRPYGSGHRGVDLAAAAGTPVRAAAAGEVVYAGVLAGRGVVSVQHRNGIRTTYEPVEARVSAGDEIGAGQMLGYLSPGHPSCAPAVCLHWGARVRAAPTGPDSYMDPMLLLTGWPVRLLPWDG